MHKSCDFPKCDGYTPIQVGAAINPRLDVMQDDSCDDNISSKNPYFCELTALYHIWKNTNDPIVGLVHYRRFFFKNKLSTSKDNIVSYKEFFGLLNDNIIVLPQKHYFRTSNYEQYNKLHYIKDMDLCGEVIKELTPDYYSSYSEIMNRKYIYPYNMFVMTRKNFDEYMEWMFLILFELEKRIDISEYDAYNKRIWGFISERLLNIWVLHKKLRIVSYPVYNNEENSVKHFKDEVENTIKKFI